MGEPSNCPRRWLVESRGGQHEAVGPAVPLPSAAVPQRVDAIEGPSGPLAVDWVYPGAGDMTWAFDSEHFRRPLVPLEVWCHWNDGPGIDRAWSEVDLVPPNVFRRWQLVGPYLYFCDTPSDAERSERMHAGLARLVEEHGSVLRFWQSFCWPRLLEVCDRISRSSDEPFVAIAEAWGYAWHQTFTSYSLLDHFFDPLIDMLERAIGPDGMLIAQELVQGGHNPSQDVDRAVWELARELAAHGESVAFRSQFDALIERYAMRAPGWTFDEPTWGEAPDTVIALVRAQANGGVAPDDREHGSEARREAVFAEALAALPAAEHARCRELLAGLEGYVEIRECRAYGQMLLAGHMRHRALRIGDELVRAGRVAQPDDVLYLLPTEWEQESGDLHDVVAARRAEYAWWTANEPPAVIGIVPDASESAPDGADLSGIAASRGVATGPARIINEPDEWDRMEPDDILVCRLSTPAWTPLFALAAAIVTEGGNCYAHPAITAREYGIPAVVGVTHACDRIADGQTITVDGTAGTITLH